MIYLVFTRKIVSYGPWKCQAMTQVKFSVCLPDPLGMPALKITYLSTAPVMGEVYEVLGYFKVILFF